MFEPHVVGGAAVPKEKGRVRYLSFLAHRKALRRHTFRHALQRSSPVFVVYWLYSLCRACAVLVFSA